MLSLLRQLFGAPAPRGSGADGERRAAAWLRRERGFTLVAANWRNPADRRDEIDLIARDGEALVFIEVKTRAAGALVPGYHAVDARKKRVLARAAKAYLAALPENEKPRTIRCDVVEVSFPASGEPEILHFENVGLFGKFGP
jgi:putative endonuclease